MLFTRCAANLTGLLAAGPRSDRERRHWAWSLFLLAFLSALLMGALLRHYNFDVVNRYIPMAEEFASGNFLYMSHPRFPPLQAILAGSLIFLFHLPSLAALLTVNAVFLGLTVVLSYRIARPIWGHRAALLGIFLLIGTSHYLKLDAIGMREPIKTYFFLLGVQVFLALLKPQANYWLQALLLALYSALMCYTKATGLAVAAVMFTIFGVWELVKCRSIHHTLAGGAVFLLLLLPLCFLNQPFLGVFAPSAQAATVLQKLPLIGTYFTAVPTDFAANAATAAAASPEFEVMYYCDDISFKTNLRNLFRGLGTWWCVGLLAAFWYRRKFKLWTAAETVVWTAIAGHTLLLVALLYFSNGYLFVERRYLAMVWPLESAVVGYILIVSWDYLTARFNLKKLNCWAVAALLLLSVGYFAWTIYRTLPIKKSIRHNQLLIEHCSKVIQQDFAPLSGSKLSHKNLPYHPSVYFSDRRPVVHGKGNLNLVLLGWLIGGQYAIDNQGVFTDYLVWSLDEYDADAPPGGFEFVERYDAPDGKTYRIYRKLGLFDR